LLVAAYIYGRPSLEKILGVSLPALAGSSETNGIGSDTETVNKKPAASRALNQPPASSPAGKLAPGKRPAGDWDSDTAVEARPFELTELANNRFESPAGLIYGPGPRGEHRIDHVMNHAEDDPARPVHSVFNGDRDSILQLIDEAYDLIQSGSNRVQLKRDGDRGEYTIDMQREIGYEGGQKGKRNDFPPLRKLKLILQAKNQVVTAYPYR
jgi:hypothetical protein